MQSKLVYFFLPFKKWLSFLVISKSGTVKTTRNAKDGEVELEVVVKLWENGCQNIILRNSHVIYLARSYFYMDTYSTSSHGQGIARVRSPYMAD